MRWLPRSTCPIANKGCCEIGHPPGSWRRCDPAILVVVGGEGLLVAGGCDKRYFGNADSKGEEAMFVCFASLRGIFDTSSCLEGWLS
jgi:hypothetical protein